MICEQIPEEFIIADFSRYDINLLKASKEAASIIKTQRDFLINKCDNKELAKIIPEDITEFYILKIQSEQTIEFYKKYHNVLYKNIYFSYDKLYLLPDIKIQLQDHNENGILFGEKYIHNKNINDIISAMLKRTNSYNMIIIATTSSSNNIIQNAYVVDAEYLLENMPDCVVCGNHKFRMYIGSDSAIQCDHCGFKITDLAQLLTCIAYAKYIKKEKEGN